MNELIKTQVRKLWECSFDDNPEFTELYFSKRYTEERNIALMKENQVMAAMQLLPYPMTFYGSILQAWYISGAATFPEHRNQGLMKELILKAFHRMQQNNIPISILIPAEDWLFNYYEKSGFATVFYAGTRTIEKSDCIHTPSPAYKIIRQTEYSTAIQHYIDKKLKEKQSAILHPKEDMEVILADLALVDGRVITVERGGEIVGLSFVWMKEGVTYINELMADSTEIEKELYHNLFTGKIDKIHTIQASTLQEGNPLGMLRIIDFKRVLDVYAGSNPEVSLQFNLTDPLLKENSGCYDITKGTCSKGPIKAGIEYKTIPELTKELFLPLSPHMSLMLN